jgi:hypothetical protein
MEAEIKLRKWTVLWGWGTSCRDSEEDWVAHVNTRNSCSSLFVRAGADLRS